MIFCMLVVSDCCFINASNITSMEELRDYSTSLFTLPLKKEFTLLFTLPLL